MIVRIRFTLSVAVRRALTCRKSRRLRLLVLVRQSRLSQLLFVLVRESRLSQLLFVLVQVNHLAMEPIINHSARRSLCVLSMVEIYRCNFLPFGVLATIRNKNFAQTRLLFDFGVVNATDIDCQQQVPSVALCLQQLTTSAVRRQSCSVYISGLAPSPIGGCIDVCTYFLFEI